MSIPAIGPITALTWALEVGTDSPLIVDSDRMLATSIATQGLQLAWVAVIVVAGISYAFWERIELLWK